MTLNRRRFLGLAAGGAATGAAAWAGLLATADDEQKPGRPASGSGRTTDSTKPTSTSGLAPADDRVLVVVQLAGGNDALNTLVPVQGAYRDARPNLAVAERNLVGLPGEDRYSLHPALAPLSPYWAAGKMAALASIGFEGASRSHFEATDAWIAGAPGVAPKTGWLGRWLDATADADGDGDGDALRAIAIGGGAGNTLRALTAPATTIIDPDRFALTAPKGVDERILTEAFRATATGNGAAGSSPVADAVRAAIPDALTSVQRLADAAVGSGSSGSAAAPRRPGAGDAEDEDPYGDGTITTRLDLAARLVAGDLGTRIVVVAANGFDTHAAQAGEHERLLSDLAQGIDRFQRAVAASGHAERVLLITTSEFGRRIVENGSGGTDHGSGGVQFLVGPGLAEAAVVGDLDAAHPDDAGDLRPTIDVRSLYSVALDWLGGPVEEIVGRRYDTYGLLA